MPIGAIDIVKGAYRKRIFYAFFIDTVFWDWYGLENWYLQDSFVCSSIDSIFQIHETLVLSKSQWALDLLEVLPGILIFHLQLLIKFILSVEAGLKFHFISLFIHLAAVNKGFLRAGISAAWREW